MYELEFARVSELFHYCVRKHLDFDQAHPMAVEGEGLYTRYRLVSESGTVVGYAVIKPAAPEK